jgi:bacterial/archaeal transporter family protein
MEQSWIYLSIAALFLYGSWGFWGVKAAPLIDLTSSAFYSSVGVLASGAICLVILKFHPSQITKGAV